MGAKGFVVLPGQEPVWNMAPGRSAALKMQSRETDESLMMFEETAPAGTATPLHLHHDSDEATYVLSGEITFKIGGETMVGGPGTCAFMPRGVAHASGVLERLGIAPYFSAILDIADAGYEPKPAPSGYRELIRRHGVKPESALMIEDIARNLEPAAALGMTTVWLRGSSDWAVDGAEGDHIHHVIDDLSAFLASAAWRQARG